MKRRSLVRYIGGQSKFSKKANPLKLNEIYTVHQVCEGNFNGKWKKAVFLKEIANKKMCFLETLFVEIEPGFDLTEIIKLAKQDILKNLN